jgi:hypothetical protein
MKRYVIERDLPGVGAMNRAQLKDAAATSNGALVRPCAIWDWKASCPSLTPVYRSGPSRTWIKVKNPKAPAATRAVDGTF